MRRLAIRRALTSPPVGTWLRGEPDPAGDEAAVVLAPHSARRWRPGLTCFVLAAAFSLLLTAWLRMLDPRTGPIGWYASVVWTLPIVLTAQGMAGGLYVRRLVTRRERDETEVAVSSQPLIVVVPTIGREDTHRALTRVLTSFCACLPAYFRCLRIDVVVDEGCDTETELLRLTSAHPLVRVVTVPRDFRTPHGTRFKARAIHYAHLLRQRDGEAVDDAWILHMDDDTSLNPYTAAEIARFVECQRRAGRDGRHLAQGILAYPREFARSRLTWYADAVRPGCDISFFPITTGRGRPRIGLHGELLLVRASVEAQIGWDFGPRTIVEDAEFAMRFCDAHPGRSAWFPACSYGASPARVSDFVKQRERWVWGLLALLRQDSIPLRRRVLLLPTIALWVGAPFANPIVLISVGFLLGDADTTPVHMAVGAVWAVNFGFYVWLYWEGFKINVRWSVEDRIRWWEPAVVIAGTPVFAVLECLGIASGLTRFLGGGAMRFTVIEKPL
ncbi:glycosyltransferase family 2 protein [Geodermatophilus sp. SYSU D00710]